MAALLASLLTLVLVIVWGVAKFVVWDLPTHLYVWISRQPWGTAPWWQPLVRWFTIPLAWVVIFAALWLLIVLWFGIPAAVLRKHGLDPSARRGIRAVFWQRMFALCCPSMSGDIPPPFIIFRIFVFLAVGLSVLAAFPLAVFLKHLPFFGHSVFPWVQRPSIPVVMLLVAYGMLAAQRSCARIVRGGESPPKDKGILGNKTAMQTVAKELKAAVDIAGSDPIIPDRNAEDKGT